MYSHITGVILAGGKSSRMGINKSLLKIGTMTLIERTVHLMTSLFQNNFLSANTPEDFQFLNFPIIPDQIKNIGPLAGIHSGLVHSSSEKIFVISCDMPLMTKETIQFLVEYPTTRPVTVAQADGFIQQLCGVYTKGLIPEIDAIVGGEKTLMYGKNKNIECRVLKLVNKVNGEIIDIKNMYPNYTSGTFFNMNNPDDYQFIKKTLLGEA